MLDEGWLTDGHGRKVDMSNTIIIMTSNLGSRASSEPEALAELKSYLSPEFINRVDDVLVFNRLTLEDMPRIVTAQLAGAEAMLGAQGIGLRVTEEAKSLIAQEGFSDEYGARPLRRYIARNVLDQVSEVLLSGDCTAGDVVEVGVGQDGAGLEVSVSSQS